MIRLLILILIPFTALTNSKLPELATKQAVDNLRFISSNGSFTYYQNREGSLLLSTNYKVSEILTSTPGTQYQIFSSPTKKYLIATQREIFHKFLSIRQMSKIYRIPYGGFGAKEIGRGVSPILHSNDDWVSIYNPIKKILTFVNLVSSALTFDISIKNNFNPYFIPEVVMPNKDTILYTDLNKKGVPGVLYYDRITKETKVLYKASHTATKLELCLGEAEVFLGEFGLDEMFAGSSISSMKRKSIDFSKRELLYESPLNDIGNLFCESSLLFVQNLKKQRNKLSYEVAELTLRDKRVKVLSDVNFASNILSMDGVILLPHLGKYYVLKGLSDYTKTDILKKNKPEALGQ